MVERCNFPAWGAGCYFEFAELTPEGFDPRLTVFDGGLPTANVWLSHRGRFRLQAGYGIFVDNEWILTASIDYEEVETCIYDGKEYDCDFETRFNSGKLVLTPEDLERLGAAIAAAGGTVELKLSSFELGSQTQHDESFVYNVPHMFGNYLRIPRAICDRLSDENRK